MTSELQHKATSRHYCGAPASNAHTTPQVITLSEVLEKNKVLTTSITADSRSASFLHRNKNDFKRKKTQTNKQQRNVNLTAQELEGRKSSKDAFVLRKFIKILCHFSAQFKCFILCQSTIQRLTPQYSLPARTVSSVQRPLRHTILTVQAWLQTSPSSFTSVDKTAMLLQVHKHQPIEYLPAQIPLQAPCYAWNLFHDFFFFLCKPNFHSIHALKMHIST